jgi:fructose-1,6-bisphosphatase/inositol monophosphatase family enzyme
MTFSSAFKPIVDEIEGAVLDAAGYLVSSLASGDAIKATLKPDHTLVLNLDIESQRRILQRLGGSYPILAEEDESSHGLVERGGTYLLVDPLDGTTSCKRFLGERGGQVGYGPLVGFVKDDVLSVASFYNIPQRKLFTAVRGEGAWVVETSGGVLEPEAKRERLLPASCSKLIQAGVLFFIGKNGESEVVQHLRNENALENLYRFGGFANDCSRLAQGSEQLSVQFTVKPWDLSAALLAEEAGLEVIVDPLRRKIPLASWRIETNSPLIAVTKPLKDELFSVLSRMKR